MREFTEKWLKKELTEYAQSVWYGLGLLYVNQEYPDYLMRIDESVVQFIKDNYHLEIPSIESILDDFIDREYLTIEGDLWRVKGFKRLSYYRNNTECLQSNMTMIFLMIFLMIFYRSAPPNNDA